MFSPSTDSYSTQEKVATKIQITLFESPGICINIERLTSNVLVRFAGGFLFIPTIRSTLLRTRLGPILAGVMRKSCQNF